MTSSLDVPFGSLRGCQEPRISSYPPYATSAGAEAVKLARLAGIELDPWQQMELAHGVGESSDWKCSKCTHRSDNPEPCPDHPNANLLHPWAAFEVTEVVPRQNGKSELLIARMLAGLFIFDDPLQIYTAHLFDTAMEVFRRLAFVVENCDDLRREVKHRGSKMVGITHSHGQEGIELQSDIRVRFKARTAGGGRGFSSDTLYLDEAMILPEKFLGATVPTLSAKPNPQLWFAGSAPDDEDPSHDGMVLAKRRSRALVGGDRSLAYFEHSAEGEHPDAVGSEILDNPEQWALANPGLGIRITPEYVANERAAMGARQFAVERLGIGAWPSIGPDAARVIPGETWDALEDLGSRIHGTRTFALDVDPGQAWATLSAAGPREDGLYHIGVTDHERGLGWVVERCRERLDRATGSRLVVDPRADLADLILELEQAGIQPIRTSPSDYKDACGGFLRAVIERQVRYRPPQPELDLAVASAKQKPLLDAWKWDRKSGAVMTPLISVTLALWGSRTQGAPRVYDLNEIVAGLRDVQETAPAGPPGADPAVEQGRVTFVPL